MKRLVILLCLCAVNMVIGQEGLNVLNGGKLGLNTTTMLGSSDVTFSFSKDSYSGMYLNSNGQFARPFYGYAVDDNPMAWHFFEEVTNRLVFHNGQENFAIGRDGVISIGNYATENVFAGAILDMSKSKKGVLFPELTTQEKNNLPVIKTGLMLFDTDMAELQVFTDSWRSVGSPWRSIQSQSSNGIYYDDGINNIGVGTIPSSEARLELVSYQQNGIRVNSLYVDDSQPKNTGIESNILAQSIGEKTAVMGRVYANDFGADQIWIRGLVGEACQSDASIDAIGVYGYVEGSGEGDRWAGYFDGNTYTSGSHHVSQTLTLDGAYNGYASSASFYTNSFNNIKGVEIRGSAANGQGGDIILKNDAGTTTVRSDGDYNNYGRIETGELSITGGADLAELFEAEQDVQPGDVVSVSTIDPQQISRSKGVNDRTVIGVVSGAGGVRPGMIMGQEGSVAYGDVPVAIAGRVYVKVADESSIAVGDFLTTSEVNGRATKVKDWDQSRGSIIGKALTTPNEEGLVLVLIQLQ